MRKSLILVLLFVSAAVAYAQKDMRQVQDYEELTDTKPHDGPDVWGGWTPRPNWGGAVSV